MINMLLYMNEEDSSFGGLFMNALYVELGALEPVNILLGYLALNLFLHSSLVFTPPNSFLLFLPYPQFTRYSKVGNIKILQLEGLFALLEGQKQEYFV